MSIYNSGSCIICLEDFNKGIDYTYNCINGHYFHEDCQLNLDNYENCCICKKDIIKDCLFLYE